ncbi:uncharacterized protein LOC131148842 [Malania oleifera]|uniref:uncharacterized protein LOC131148842 n=1 Tax=Malania oleifera TaxID=397392 RepID=UPI0025AECADA|nr:uncharacterized protein LOC131148842 [Malania oleifera]
MKTVSGKVASSKPISLSKAAKVLSKFVSADTGASPAVSAYLRRASDSFNELALLHRELRASQSSHKHRKPRSEPNGRIIANPEGAKENFRDERPAPEEQSYGRDFDGTEETDGARRKHKKNKKERFDDVAIDSPEVEETVDRGSVQVVEERGKKERKKRKSGEVQDGEIEDSAERHSKKQRRK